MAKYRLHLFIYLTAIFVVPPAVAWQLPASQIQSLTPDRILAQPNLNGELLRQLHWTSNGTRLAWLRTTLSPAPPPAPGPPSPQLAGPPATEIWSLDTVTAHSSLLVSATQLAAALGAAAPVRRTEDDDHPAAPAHLTDYAWSPDGRALLLITPVSLVWLDLESGYARTLVSGQKS